MLTMLLVWFSGFLIGCATMAATIRRNRDVDRLRKIISNQDTQLSKAADLIKRFNNS